MTEEGQDQGKVVEIAQKVDKRRGPHPRKPHIEAVKDAAYNLSGDVSDMRLMVQALTHGWRATWYESADYHVWVWIGPCDEIVLTNGQSSAPSMTEALKVALLGK